MLKKSMWRLVHSLLEGKEVAENMNLISNKGFVLGCFSLLECTVSLPVLTDLYKMGSPAVVTVDKLSIVNNPWLCTIRD